MVSGLPIHITAGVGAGKILGVRWIFARTCRKVFVRLLPTSVGGQFFEVQQRWALFLLGVRLPHLPPTQLHITSDVVCACTPLRESRFNLNLKH